MKLFKRLLSLILTVIMLVSMFSASAIVSHADEGVCGDSLTWRFSPASGVLTILGEGEMYDFEHSIRDPLAAPWSNYRSEIKKVILGSGITSIGEFAFAECTALESITFPLSVESIGLCAFGDCQSLKSIIIPDNITSIGSQAFIYCTSLEKVVLGNGLIEIEYGTFYGCSSLKDVTFGKGLTSIESEAFYNCTSYENIVLPDHYVALSYDSFAGTGYYGNEDNWDNGGLYIGEYFLYGNKTTNGTFVIRPGTKYVSRYALYEFNPGTVYYPRSIEIINEPVVYVYRVGGVHEPYDSPYVIGFTGTPVSGGTFCLCPPDGKTGNVYYKFDETGTVLTFYGNGAIGNYEYYYERFDVRFGAPWEYVLPYIYEVVIDDGITSIGKNAFPPNVKRATLADSVTHINSEALRGLFTTLNLPKNLEYICPTNFIYTTKLEELTISEDNPNYTTMDGILYSKDMKTLIKYPCAKKDEHFAVPDTVTALDPNAFNDLQNLKTLYIPETVTKVDNISTENGVTIQCKLNSAAHDYARANNIPYEIICDHSFTDYTEHPATCTEDGYKSAECDLGCGAVDKVIYEGTAKGHNFATYMNNNNATCTENSTSTAVCENGCGVTDTRTNENTAYGHSFTDYSVVIPADCTNDEIQEAFCDRGCGTTDTRTAENTALGHLFTDYTVVISADCTHDELLESFCDRGCGGKDVVTVEGSAWGHSFTDYKVITEASCTEKGVKEALCDHGCGEKDVITEEAIGHTPGEWIVIEEPDYDHDGYRIRNCTVCSEVVNTEIIPALVYEGFPDVPEDAWYYEGIEYCYKQGYIMGTDKGIFDPNGKLTREQFVVILARISGAKLSEYTESTFTDVNAESWYGPSVIWASENGYVNGTGKGRFGVGQYLTREQLAVMFFRYAEKRGENVSERADLSYCGDEAAVSDWARDACAWAIKATLLGSTSETENLLSPKMTVTRAQAAKIFMSYDAYIVQ